MIKYPKIQSLHNIRKSRAAQGLIVNYTGTIKLHGTNAGVRFVDGRINPQSRERTLSIQNDNAGFAAWCLAPATQGALFSLKDRIAPGQDDVTLFGEWVGPNVQRGVAISKIERKVFVLLGAYVNDTFIGPVCSTSTENEAGIYSIVDVPTYHITINYGDYAAVLADAATINQWVEEVEKCCPFTKAVFGVEGIGEGIVFKCGDPELWFKAKGAAHRGARHKEAVVLEPATLDSIEEFVAFALTEARLNQGLEHVTGRTSDQIGPFLHWISQDVATECVDELTDNNLTWKDVVKPLQRAAREWFVR
jgi:hypothetical protein